MKALIALVPLVFFAVGFFLGRMKTPASKHYEQMYQVSTRRLTQAERVLDDLSSQATDHVMFGESFAVIAQDEIRKYRNSERNLS